MKMSKKLCQILALVALIYSGVSSHAALSISEVPLFLRSGVVPNVVMTIDDSLSMSRGYVPDDVGDSASRRNSPRYTAASYNAMYYNPKVQYTIPVRNDGVTYSTSFTTAYVNGFDTSKGAVNLSSNGYLPTLTCQPGQTKDTCTDSSNSANGAGGYTNTTTAPYSYRCTVSFNNRNNNNDRIEVSACNPVMPASGVGSPGEADNLRIVVSNVANSSYNKTYTVASSSSNGGSVYINLSNGTQITQDSNGNSNVLLSWTETQTETVTSGPAYYHFYYDDITGTTRPAGCDDGRGTNACYVYVNVNLLDADKKQNFAIWYSFYRTRALATMSAATNAVTSIGRDEVRLGWQTLNNGGCNSFGTTCTGYDGANRENRIRTLDALKSGSTTVTHRTDFYNWIGKLRVGDTTPLRAAMDRAGQYYSSSGLNSPYAQEPYVTLGTEHACRRNFHVMMTDGLWNSNGNTNYGGNVDSTSRVLPDGESYTPQYPYANTTANPPSGLSYKNNLADIAFKYWATDLRSDLANSLTPYVIDRSGTKTQQYWNPRNNPAKWQHMVNYTISFGLSSVLVEPEAVWEKSTYTGDYAKLVSGAKLWPATNENPNLNEEPVGHVYDLWHAAINSRGEFFNAADPTTVAQAFQSAFDSISNRNPSSAALAANSTSIKVGSTMLFQAKYDSTDWRGQLLALSVNNDGVIGAEYWDAAKLMPAASARNITTWNGAQGTVFAGCTVSTMSVSQKALLDANPPNNTAVDWCAQRVAWLRGDDSRELRNGGVFRDRVKSGPEVKTVLGDLVNSAPVYVKDEDYGYAGSAGDLPEKSTYAAFVAGKETRLPMVYVGGNDGMLHAFRADVGAAGESGKEIWAHVPSGVYPRLTRLTEPNYSHTHYVDGSPSVGDAYFGGGWKTVLVSGLAGGGRSVFAIDITTPQAHAADKIMWEYADATDLGLTYSQPVIARLNNGQWAAIFGNGYNSASDRAYLYIVNLSTGVLIKKIAAGAATSNGLSSPVVYDSNGDKIVDAVYAGDLQGNLWKFDLSAASSDAWGLGNGGVPMFIARNASGQVQPITGRPVAAKTSGQPIGGALVLFGTGSYLTAADVGSMNVQSFYAIWDNNTAGTVSKSQLQVQTILSENALSDGRKYRVTSRNDVDWSTKRGWYLDLVSPVATAGDSAERVVSYPLVYKDQVLFVTLIPSSGDPCTGDGKSWFMELGLTSGSMPLTAILDVNGDTVAAGVMDESKGILQPPVLLKCEKGVCKEFSGSSGNTNYVNNEPPGPPGGGGGSVKRIFWQQIQ